MSVKRYDFDCITSDYLLGASLGREEVADGNYVLHSDYAALLARHNALKTERHSLAQEIMRQVNKNEELHERHNALREAVAWEREFDEVLVWLVQSGRYPRDMAGKYDLANERECARAEVDRLIASEGAADCQGEG